VLFIKLQHRLKVVFPRFLHTVESLPHTVGFVSNWVGRIIPAHNFLEIQETAGHCVH